MLGRSGRTGWLATMLLAITLVSATLAWAAPLTQDEELLPAEQRDALALFREAWGILQDQFLYRAALDPRRMVHGAIRGMVESLGDAETTFTTPIEHELEGPAWSGMLTGVGAYLDTRGGRVAVVDLVPGSPAERAGLRPGDAILAVDDRSVTSWPLQDVALRVRGDPGTRVELSLERAGTPVRVSIVREAIELDSAHWRMLGAETGLLCLTSFTERTDRETGAALEQLASRGTRALVLDLRGNLGGYLRPAVEVASRFVASGAIVWQENGRGERYAYERLADRPLVDWPMVVLMDHRTASASEVVAAALRDYGRARLVGERTWGKGTVQYRNELSDKSGLNVTAARWITPSGLPLDKGGLAPDVVADTVRSEAADPGLRRGLEVLAEVARRGVQEAGAAVGERGCRPTTATAA